MPPKQQWGSPSTDTFSIINFRGARTGDRIEKNERPAKPCKSIYISYPSSFRVRICNNTLKKLHQGTLEMGPKLESLKPALPF